MRATVKIAPIHFDHFSMGIELPLYGSVSNHPGCKIIAHVIHQSEPNETAVEREVSVHS